MSIGNQYMSQCITVTVVTVFLLALSVMAGLRYGPTKGLHETRWPAAFVFLNLVADSTYAVGPAGPTGVSIAMSILFPSYPPCPLELPQDPSPHLPPSFYHPCILHSPLL